MPLSPLNNWDTTRSALHRAAKPVGAARLLLLPHDPLYLELALHTTEYGLTTGALPGGASIELDFPASALRLRAGDGAVTTIALNGLSQRAITTQIMDWIRASVPLDTVEQADAKIRGFLSEPDGVAMAVGASELNDESPLLIDPALARDYAEALFTVHSGIALFRARLKGLHTPLVVYPHGFDLSMIWFAGNAFDESQPHLNFGFSPGSSGLPRPYVYAYAHPLPKGCAPPSLPSPAVWHTQGWTGVVLPYDEFREQSNVSAYLVEMCERIFETLNQLLHG
jgi:hypothetical protein